MTTASITDFSTKASQTTVDNNDKLVLANGSLTLDEFQDHPGSTLDSNWTATQFRAFTEAGSFTEGSNVIAASVSGGTRAKLLRTPYSYQYGTWEIHFSNHSYTTQGNAYIVVGDNTVGNSWDNAVTVFYSRAASKVFYIQIHTSGSVTYQANSSAIDVTDFDLKIIKETNGDIKGYYDIGAGWVQIGATQNVALPGSNYFGIAAYTTNAVDFDIDDILMDGTGVYWSDSPEAFLDFGGANGTLDATAGKTLALSDWTETLTGALPANTTVKYDIAVADTDGYGDGGFTGTWRNETDFAALLAGGTKDGTRYASFKVQINSDGSATPDIASLAVDYTAVSSGGGRSTFRGIGRGIFRGVS